MHDAKVALQQLYPNVEADPYTVHELLYADDTLLIGTESNQIQSYMNVVVDLGATYGLQLNWKKVELLAARCSPIINDKEGLALESKTSIGYLGALLDASGKIQSELHRRIGMASADFKVLSRIWNHSDLSRTSKVRIYMSCIVSKLLYGLQSAWLTKVQRAKLDGFHARCVREIAGIKHAYWSRASNFDVLASMFWRQCIHIPFRAYCWSNSSSILIKSGAGLTTTSYGD